MIVAMSSNARTTQLLLRRGSSIAGRLNTNWFAVYVRTRRETPQQMSAKEHRQLSENVTLAMELGAKVVWLTGEDIADELLRFARQQGVTLIVFGKSPKPLWRRLIAQSPIDAFASEGTGLDVLEIETQAVWSHPSPTCPSHFHGRNRDPLDGSAARDVYRPNKNWYELVLVSTHLQ